MVCLEFGELEGQGCLSRPPRLRSHTPTHTPAPQSPPVPEHPGPELGRGWGQGASGELAEGAGVLKRS